MAEKKWERHCAASFPGKQSQRSWAARFVSNQVASDSSSSNSEQDNIAVVRNASEQIPYCRYLFSNFLQIQQKIHGQENVYIPDLDLKKTLLQNSTIWRLANLKRK